MSGGWISVEERVPKENGTYPVFGTDARGRKVRTLADWDAGDNRWYATDYGYHGEWTTHWAEWPEDPVGGRAAGGERMNLVEALLKANEASRKFLAYLDAAEQLMGGNQQGIATSRAITKTLIAQTEDAIAAGNVLKMLVAAMGARDRAKRVLRAAGGGEAVTGLNRECSR